MGKTTRHVGVIATTVAVIALAGLWYARPDFSFSVASEPAAAQPAHTVLTGPYSFTYDFVTPFLGWALAVDYSAFSTRAWLFKTVDGGRDWYREYVGRAVGDRTFLHFFDQENGVAFTGVTYRTADGGDHWKTVNVPGARPYVTYASPTLGWAEDFDSLPTRLYRTTDGGNSWKFVGTPPNGATVLQPAVDPDALTFRENCEGWLGAGGVGRPTAFQTTDCGSSWSSIALHGGGPVDPSLRYQTSVRLIGDSTVVVFDGGEKPLYGALLSPDAGATWRAMSLPAPLDSPAEVSMVDASNWWMFREGTVYTTDNAGISWGQPKDAGMPRAWNFEAAHAIDGTHAWVSLVATARSDQRALVMTADGGAHWEMVTMPVP